MRFGPSAWFLAVAALGCAGPGVTRDPRVAIRERRGADDSAVAVIYPATVCRLTIRDASGRTFDRTGDERLDELEREVPNRGWEVRTPRRPSTLFTALALPPGRYQLVKYLTSDEWEELEATDGSLLGRTRCMGRLEHHSARLPFRIERGKVTLLTIPTGPPSLSEIQNLARIAEDPLMRRTSGSWYDAIQRARRGAYAERAARLRKPRSGYDVYPECDGRVAVVRTLGAPFPWYSDPDDATARRKFRHDVSTALRIRSLHATGFGSGCVRRRAFSLILLDPLEVNAAVSALGEWMVEQDLSGEIDVILAAPLLGGASASPRLLY